MSRWFRVYDDLVDDPKVQRLPGDMVKSLLNLWCLASQNDGILPAADDIAFKLRMTLAKVQHVLSVLGECGLIDSDEEGLRPHNWNGRQYKSDVADPTAASRQKAYRDRLKNRNATVTVTDTRTDTEQITEQNRVDSARKRGARLPDDWLADPKDWPDAVLRLGVAGADQELLKFKDYWKAQPGQRGVKLDWDATWRNWIRNAKGTANGRRTVHDAAKDLTRHLQALAAIDEPAPSGLCEQEGGTPLRLLPAGRRE